MSSFAWISSCCHPLVDWGKKYGFFEKLWVFEKVWVFCVGLGLPRVLLV